MQKDAHLRKRCRMDCRWSVKGARRRVNAPFSRLHSSVSPQVSLPGFVYTASYPGTKGRKHSAPRWKGNNGERDSKSSRSKLQCKLKGSGYQRTNERACVCCIGDPLIDPFVRDIQWLDNSRQPVIFSFFTCIFIRCGNSMRALVIYSIFMVWTELSESK